MTSTFQINALFQGGGTKQLKKGVNNAKKLARTVAPPPVRRSSGPPRAREELWIPNTTRPDWLDGSLPGDRGFDPLGLARNQDYLQVSLDSLDQTKSVNEKGKIIGSADINTQPNEDPLSPYNEVFGLERFRECEVIHGRWAMLAALGCIVGEAATGVSWVDAGKVELDGTSYLGVPLPFTVDQVTFIEAILVGGAEIYRNGARGLDERIYPGGPFDPLGLTSGVGEERTFELRESEIKHGRMAMLAFLAFSIEAQITGQGALGSLTTLGDAAAA